MKKVLAIDPGVETGYCYAKIQDGRLQYKPSQAVDDVDELLNRLQTFKPDIIVMEDFEYRNRARSGLNLFPVQLIGVARLYSLKAPHTVGLYLQKAAQGKSYYTDNILKQLNLHVKGLPHGMDASRHLLQWCTFGAGYQYINGSQRDFAQLVSEINFE